MIGLCGAHRTGKTTLAKAWAEHSRARFVQTSTTAFFRELGVSPGDTFTFWQRLVVQEHVLRRTDEVFYSQVGPGEPAITDRTPLDMLMYTMAEAIGDRVLPEDQERFARYANACFDITNKRFSTVLLVQPGIPLVDCETEKGGAQAAANPAYIEHLNSLCLGLSVDQRLTCAHYYIPRQNLTVEDRLRCIENACRRTETYSANDAADYVARGGLIH